MLKRITLDIKYNKLKNVIRLILLTAFFCVIFSSLSVNHIGDVFGKYITDNYKITVQVISDINDETKWNTQDINQKYESAAQYYQYINSIDHDLYKYGECITDAATLMPFSKENGVVTSISSVLRKNDTLENEISQFQTLASNFITMGTNLTCRLTMDDEFYDLRNNNVKIIEGRSFTDEELKTGKNVCVVAEYTATTELSEGVVTARYLHPGDTLKLSTSSWDGEKNIVDTYEYEVIGVYRPVSDFINYKYCYLSYGAYQKVINNIIKYDSVNQSTDVPGIAFFEVNGMQQLNEIIEYIKTNDYGYNYLANTDEYSEILSSSLAVANNIKGISIISFGICLLFCVVLTVLDIFYRKKEIGLLQSFGEEKKSILQQLLVEEGLFYIVASAAAYAISKLLSKLIVNYLLNSNNHDIFVVGGHQVQAPVIDIDLSVNMTDMFIYVGYVIVLIIVNALIVNIMINKYSPKELLAGD